MKHQAIDIPREAIAAFCRRNRIRRLSVFGSVLRDDFRSDSDIDMLVEFEPDARVSLFDVGGMMYELTEMLGRQVDLRTPADLSRYFREQVIADSELLYAA
ncbi:MAG: nucleotidyltransferase family protein [Phycisphaerales bacterium]